MNSAMNNLLVINLPYDVLTGNKFSTLFIGLTFLSFYLVCMWKKQGEIKKVNKCLRRLRSLCNIHNKIL